MPGSDDTDSMGRGSEREPGSEGFPESLGRQVRQARQIGGDEAVFGSDGRLVPEEGEEIYGALAMTEKDKWATVVPALKIGSESDKRIAFSVCEDVFRRWIAGVEEG